MVNATFFSVFRKKAPKHLVTLKKVSTFAPQFGTRYIRIKFFRGVAQLVAFLVWDQAVAGSSPVTPTEKTKFDYSFLVFFLYSTSPLTLQVAMYALHWDDSKPK